MSDNKLHPKQAPSSDDSAKLDRKIIQDSWRQQVRLSSHATLGLIIASTFFNILGINTPDSFGIETRATVHKKVSGI